MQNKIRCMQLIQPVRNSHSLHTVRACMHTATHTVVDAAGTFEFLCTQHAKFCSPHTMADDMYVREIQDGDAEQFTQRYNMALLTK